MSEQTISIPSKIMRNDNEFPLFWNPEEYLKFRKGKFILGFFKRWFEMKAIDNCLKGLDDIHSVCDIPCGPGTLFPYWHKKGYKVIAADLSDPMIDAADKMSKHLNLEGSVIKCNAFALKDSLQESEVDLIASIRFFYYFKKDKRIELLKTMAEVTRKYVLVQYRTLATRKGRLNQKQADSNRQFCSIEEILEELKVARLDCIKVFRISPSPRSDRVFVTARNRK
jgi:ubiquinone/menaquinone biosynthesis C-methylase UbiE